MNCYLQSSLTIIAIMSGNLAQLVDSYSTGGWIFYGLVFGGLLIMRVTHRKAKRRFKVNKIDTMYEIKSIYRRFTFFIVKIFSYTRRDMKINFLKNY